MTTPNEHTPNQDLIDFYKNLTPNEVFSLVTGIPEDEVKRLGGMPKDE